MRLTARRYRSCNTLRGSSAGGKEHRQQRVSEQRGDQRLRGRLHPLVSHDRRLLEACVDRLWLVADGAVKPFEGDLDDYRRFVLAKTAPNGEEKPGAEAPGARADERREAAKTRRDVAPLRKDIAAAEEKMRRFAELIARVDEALAKPEAFAEDAAKALVLARRRGELEKALIAAEELWLTLSGDAEAD